MVRQIPKEFCWVCGLRARFWCLGSHGLEIACMTGHRWMPHSLLPTPCKHLKRNHCEKNDLFLGSMGDFECKYGVYKDCWEEG